MTTPPLNGKQNLRRSAIVVASFVGLLWLIRLVDVIFDLRLFRFSVYPRELEGLWGILFAPLIHGSWVHLFANTLPFFVLGTALLYGYPRSAMIAVPIIYFGSSLGVWCFARSSYHVGASGLTHGLMFFIFIIGVLRRDKLSMALAMLVYFLYGGMIWGIFPSNPEISFEYHFFGALLGTILAYFLRNLDPKSSEKKYDWEDEN
jgi:membrane associated rhomboid family serine protease